MSKVDDGVGVHCRIPQAPAQVIGVQEYRTAMKEARNKGQRLRVALRVLSSLGYNANCDDEEFRKIISPYLEDFNP